VLLTAIWILVVLLILVGGFVAMSHSETEIARNYEQRCSARWAARTGIRRAQAQVLSLVAQEPYLALGGPQMVIDGSNDQSALDGASYTAVLQDEAGKLNINTATATELAVFFPTDVASNILSWRGASSASGVGNEYYNGLPTPYNCKKAPFNTVNELLLVDGVTPAILNAVVTSGGLTLRDILTTSSVDSNLSMTGRTRLNVTTLTSRNAPNGSVQLNSQLNTLLTTFRISTATKNAIQTYINNSASRRRRWKSPADLLNVPNVTLSQMAAMYDRLTITTNSTVAGLVNLNTATPEVLGALDGMDAATAQLIVQYVANQGALTNAGQLFTISGIRRTMLINIAGFFTTRSARFSAVSTGKGASGMSQTISCLMQDELSNGTAIIRTLYWHE